MNKDFKRFYGIEVQIEVTGPPIDNKWYIKWEPNIIKEVTAPIVAFFAIDMSTAMERVNYITSVHSGGYIKSIKIKNNLI